MSEHTPDTFDDKMAEHADEVDAVEANPQSVPVNMYEADGAIVIITPLAGVTADDITVVVEPGRVRISAAMRTPAPKSYLLHEWHYGPYERTVDVPDDVGLEAAATFRNGQLALRLVKGGAPTSPLEVRPT